MAESAQQFTVLTVCTGNICRSPAAERLIQSVWAEGDPRVHAESAGVHALVGEPIYITMAHLVEQAGAYSGEFRAQALDEEVLARADLVLGMTQRHRATAVGMLPSALADSFTLLEFARIVTEHRDEFSASGDRVADLRELRLLASQRRGPVEPGASDDIADPYGRSLLHYQQAFDEIEHAVAGVAAVLSGAPTPEPLAPHEVVEPLSAAGDGLLTRLWHRRS